MKHLKLFENFLSEDSPINSFYQIAKSGNVQDLSELDGDEFTFSLNGKNIRIFWDEDSLCTVIDGDINWGEPHEISESELSEMVS